MSPPVIVLSSISDPSLVSGTATDPSHVSVPSSVSGPDLVPVSVFDPSSSQSLTLSLLWVLTLALLSCQSMLPILTLCHFDPWACHWPYPSFSLCSVIVHTWSSSRQSGILTHGSYVSSRPAYLCVFSCSNTLTSTQEILLITWLVESAVLAKGKH